MCPANWAVTGVPVVTRLMLFSIRLELTPWAIILYVSTLLILRASSASSKLCVTVGFIVRGSRQAAFTLERRLSWAKGMEN